MRRLQRALIVLILLFAFVGTGVAQQSPERIRFAPYTDSIEIGGEVAAYTQDTYVFRAFAGQSVYISAGSLRP